MTQTPLIQRSELTTPASNMKMLESAAESDADAVMLDLEDAVAHDEKEGARETLIEAVETLDWGAKRLSVRINDLSTQYAYRDIVTVYEAVGDRLDMVTLPKAECGPDIYVVDTLLSQIEQYASIDSPIEIEVLIEGAAGVQNVDEIAAASDRLTALIFGPGDYSVSLRIPFTSTDEYTETGYPGDKWHHARTMIVNAARGNGLDAIDGPYPNFSDPEGYREQADYAKELGFSGKWAIHPSQIEIANEVYTPNDGEIDHAQTVIDEIENAESEGAGAVSVDGVMMDLANIKYAQQVVEKADALDLRSP